METNKGTTNNSEAKSISPSVMDGVQAVIFDLDGTLIDSMWMWKQIDIEFLGRFGYECPEDLQKSIEGMSFSETAHYFKERFQLSDTVDEIKAAWNQMAWDKYSKEILFKTGAKEFVYYLKKNGIRTGIATSNSIELVKAVLGNHDMEKQFDSIHTSCEVSKGKPAPDIYELVAKDLGVEPMECLVFEDIPQGIMAGKNAGMKVCAVEDTYSAMVADKKRELSDYYIKDYFEISFM